MKTHTLITLLAVFLGLGVIVGASNAPTLPQTCLVTTP